MPSIQDEFAMLLDKIDPDKDLKGFAFKPYFLHFLTHRQYYLEIFSTLLDEIVTKTKMNNTDISLVDFGAGCGFLGFFAKYSGFGRVTMVDMNPNLTAIQRIISRKLNLPVDAMITGDSNVLESIQSSKPNMVIAATDVIEHIYDLHKFFKDVCSLPHRPTLFFTTSANNSNYIKRKEIIRLQVNDEWKGWVESELPGLGTREKSFREIRGAMIQHELQNLGREDLDKLIRTTRGMNQQDIIKACENFRLKNIFPIEISHPTNTCDPDSGSWTERLLSFDEYRKIFEENKYELEIKNGFYNEFGGGIKSAAARFLNKFIKVIGSNGRRISPFVILTGIPST